MSRCIVCHREFKEGEYLQAFLRCTEDPSGSWTDSFRVDADYQNRAQCNNDKIKRKHETCKEETNG